MLKFKLCRICMKLKNNSSVFVKIFESTEKGDLVANLLIDCANVCVETDDGLPQIICVNCLHNLVKYCEFQKQIRLSDTRLAELAEKTPKEVDILLSQPMVSIEKVTKRIREDVIVKLEELPEVVEETELSVDIANESILNESTSQQVNFDNEHSYAADDDDEWPEEPVNLQNELSLQLEVPKFFCCQCADSFREEHELLEHAINVHFNVRRKAHVPKDGENARQCELCFKFFKNFEALVNHQYQYKNRSAQCEQCGIIFLKKWCKQNRTPCDCPQEECPAETIKIPKPIKKAKCDVCQKEVNFHNLKTHMQLHQDRPPIKCPRCPKICYENRLMIIHMNRHKAQEVGRTVPCKYPGCRKMFYAQDNLDQMMRLHMKTHTGEKPFTCKYCEKRFADRTDCTRHEWYHTGLSPYMCSKCNKMYTRKSHLLNHEATCRLRN